MNKALHFSWAALSLSASLVFAQDYPNKPIKMVVPYPPGGVTDMATRAVSAKMSEAFGQAIIVENQPAAGGVVATNAVAKVAPDGYTLLSAFDSFATNPFMYKGVQHDPLKDFAPISLMVRSPQVLVVYPGTGIKNMSDLLKMAKAKGDHFSFATPGAGTSSRLSTELFKQYAGLDATLVTYKGGSQAMTDLLGGQVNAMIVSLSLVLQHIQGGRLTPIAVSSTKRVTQLPDVPPIADTFPGFEAQSWTGMVAPAGTPKAVIDKLNAALVKALNSSDFKDKFTSQGVEVVGSSPEAFADWMNKESAKWSQVIKQRKISIE
jgi:hypothetical protein